MKFSSKDLINVGIFTVLYVVVIVVVGQLSAILPITQVIAPLYLPVFAGIPFMLFLTRVTHFGMVTLMGLIVGLIILATGQSYWVLLIAATLGVLGDVVMNLGHYQRWPNLVLGYVLFSLMMVGTVVPLYFMRDAFIAKISARHDAAWVQQLVDWTPPWMFVLVILMIAVGAVGGAFLGRAMLRKHFERAGIA